MHKLVHNNAPKYMTELIQRPNRVLPGREYDVKIPQTTTSLYQTSFVPKCCSEWNKLPPNIKSIQDKLQFKSKLSQIPKYRRKHINKYYLLGSRAVNIILS